MKLKNLRLTKGLSQEELSEISGVSVRTIQRIEKGNAPSLESAKSLAQALGVTPSVFLEEVIEKVEDGTEQLKYLKPLALGHFILAIFAIISIVISIASYYKIRAFQAGIVQASFTVLDIFIVIMFVWVLVNILAGYLLMMRKARVFCMGLTVFNLLFTPLGTILGALTLYYLMRSDVVKEY